MSSIKFDYRTQSNSIDAIGSGVLALKFLYYELLANLMFEIRHRKAPGNIQDLFLIFILIMLGHLF